ncbi:MAG: hypothetical protein IKH77_00040 [Clostridia bacterium]|nr:hypothetical protein [Clostridia bacterium]
MLRKYHTKALAWPEKTLSMMQQQMLEDSEARIAQLPSFGLWTGCTDTNVEELWHISYDAQERSGETVLHTVELLRKRVLDLLPEELLFLPAGEYDLLCHLIREGGETALTDWGDTAPAESLVRRLWCTLERQGDQLLLRLPQALRTPMGRLLSSKAHAAKREMIMRHLVAVFGALTIYGMVFASDVQAFFGSLTERPVLLRRLMHAGFDYTYTPEGAMVLLHPALAEPDHWFRHLVHVDLQRFLDIDPDADVPQIFLSEAECASAVRLGTLIAPCLRPDLPPGMVVEDLRMLAKQGVSFEALTEVLAAQLACKPTQSMLDALRVMYGTTPGFICVNSRLVH